MTNARSPESRDVLDAGTYKFSVVVPVFEQWNLVPELISCIEKQTSGLDDVEVFLVDNGSSAFNVPPNIPPQFHVLSYASPGSYAARNHGAAHAQGKWLIFTDADCRPSPGWLASLHKKISEGPAAVALVGGEVCVVPVGMKPNIFEIYDMVRGIRQDRYVPRGYAATANLAVKKQVFHELGGFDACRFSGGDAEFCRRAGREGFTLVYSAEASVNHPARSSWQELSTKARRVKGGQIGAGTIRRRLLWSLVTLVPPLRESAYLLRRRRFSLRHRLLAVAVQHGLWLVELTELLRLAKGNVPERR